MNEEQNWIKASEIIEGNIYCINNDSYKKGHRIFFLFKGWKMFGSIDTNAIIGNEIYESHSVGNKGSNSPYRLATDLEVSWFWHCMKSKIYISIDKFKNLYNSSNNFPIY